MEKQKLNKVIDKAQDICAKSGARLTEKRQKILELLLLSNKPLSAYEVADRYNKDAEATMPPMSVYRILDFLESEELVHKLVSANKYIACSHIACCHIHEVPQFLICNNCQKVKEISISRSIFDELDKQVASSGYKLMHSQLELQCLCDSCMPTAV